MRLRAAEELNDDRPRERLFRRGATASCDEDLLAVLLGTGVRAHSARAIADALVASSGGLAALSRASPHELAQAMGVGMARAARIAAAFELGRRAVECTRARVVIRDPEDVFEVIAPRVAGLAQETFWVIGLGVRNQLLDVLEVGRGTVASVEVHPREIFRPLVRMAAAAGVLVHNHPSGDPSPSEDDRELTRRLRAVGAVVGIPIVDHVVVGASSWSSIAEVLEDDA